MWIQKSNYRGKCVSKRKLYFSSEKYIFEISLTAKSAILTRQQACVRFGADIGAAEVHCVREMLVSLDGSDVCLLPIKRLFRGSMERFLEQSLSTVCCGSIAFLSGATIFFAHKGIRLKHETKE